MSFGSGVHGTCSTSAHNRAHDSDQMRRDAWTCVHAGKTHTDGSAFALRPDNVQPRPAIPASVTSFALEALAPGTPV